MSDEKIYDKYVVGANPDDCNTGHPVEPIPMREVGERKFDKNGYGESIYADDTRNEKGVPDDSDAYSPLRVAMDSGEEESQGI